MTILFKPHFIKNRNIWPSSLKVWPNSLCVWLGNSYGASSKHGASRRYGGARERRSRARAAMPAGALLGAVAIAAGPDTKAAGPDFEAAGPDFKAAGPDFEAAGPNLSVVAVVSRSAYINRIETAMCLPQRGTAQSLNKNVMNIDGFR